MGDLKYLTDSYDVKIAKIKEINAPLNFLFMCDQHNRMNHMDAMRNGTDEYELAVNAIDSMHYILERCPEITFLVNGGDMINDYEPDPVKAHASLQEVMDAFYRLPIPVHTCIGNHDDAIGTAMVRGWDVSHAAILPDEMHELCMKYNPTDKNYYYIDVDAGDDKWRMIFLNTADSQYVMRNGKFVAPDNSQISWEQIAWFRDDASKTDRNIIVFSHQPIHNGPFCDEHGVRTGFNPFDNVHGAPEVYYYAFHRPNVKFMVAGHTHYDYIHVDRDLPTITTMCSLTQEPRGCHNRVYGTPTETAFDVFSIKNGLVYMTRFGAGEDRSIILPRMRY